MRQIKMQVKLKRTLKHKIKNHPETDGFFIICNLLLQV